MDPAPLGSDGGLPVRKDPHGSFPLEGNDSGATAAYAPVTRLDPLVMPPCAHVEGPPFRFGSLDHQVGPLPSPVDVKINDIPVRITGVLGRGGLGIVYKGIEGVGHNLVAIKTVLDISDQALKARTEDKLRKEFAITGAFNHPAIVGTRFFGTHEGQPCFVLQYVDGDTFTAAASKLSGTEGNREKLARYAVEKVIAVCDALRQAHARTPPIILHRDIKPDNIMITRDGGFPFLLDWGLAREAGEYDYIYSCFVFRASDLDGTPAYMTPEQFIDGVSTASSDLYALAATLYEIVAGSKPFNVDESKPLKFQINAIRRDKIDRQKIPSLVKLLQERKEPVPEKIRELDSILRKALEVRPGDRFDSVTSFGEQLQRWRDDLTVSTYRETRPFFYAKKLLSKYRTFVAAGACVAFGFSLRFFLDRLAESYLNNSKDNSAHVTKEQRGLGPRP